MNPLYSVWMDQLLGGPVPPETEATCSDCPMCSSDLARNRSGTVFNPQVKCCTYVPDLANFLVGRIFLDRTPEFAAGRAAFEAHLKGSIIAAPLGVFPSPEVAERYRKNANHFGQSIDLLCPYYLPDQGGSCGIWQHRNARCGAWFCRFVRGSTGVVFWKYADSLFTTVERLLSRWCVLQLDPGEDALRRLFPPPPTERLFADLPLMWGRWRGHEREFFEACAHLVEPLSWTQVSAICGVEVQTAARLAYQAYESLISERLPRYLKKGNWKTVTKTDDGLTRICAYSRYDPIDLPSVLVEALAQFDGRPVSEVRMALSAGGITIDDPLLRKLIDFGLLFECAGAPAQR